MSKVHVKRDDTVVILTGKDKGKEGHYRRLQHRQQTRKTEKNGRDRRYCKS